MHHLSFIASLFLVSSFVNAEEIVLTPLSIEESSESSWFQSQEEALDTNAFTLHDRLKQDISFDTVLGEKNGEDISYRGMDTRATGYYEDGIPLYRTVNGYVASTFYAPNSALSITSTSPSPIGVSSMGGDVDILSSVPNASKEGRLSASLSSNDHRISGYIGSRLDDSYVQLTASTYKMNSYTLSDDYVSTPAQPAGERVNSDREQHDVSVKAGTFIGDHTHLAAKFAATRADFGVPHNTTLDITALPWTIPLDSYARVNQKDLNSFYLYGDYNADNIETNIRFYHDRYKDIYDWYETSSYNSFLFPTSTYDDSRTGAIVKSTLKTNSNSHSLIFQSERNTHDMIVGGNSIMSFDSDSLNISYLCDYTLSTTLNAQGALSYRTLHPKNGYEDKQLLDYQLKLSQLINTGLIYVAASHKSRFPSMNEMFDFFGTANPTLKPEQSRNLEAGYEIRNFNKASITVEGYYYDLQDIIIRSGNSYFNRDSAIHYGIETRLKSDAFSGHHLSAAYRYAHTKDSAGEAIELIPSHRFVFKEEVDLAPDYTAAVEYLYSGKRYSGYLNQQYTLDPYQTIDLYLSYVKKQGMSYRFGIKNLTDENYEWQYGYPTQGRSAFVSLEWIL